MVTKYDIFELLYRSETPLKPKKVAEELKKEYKSIYYKLKELEKENYIKKNAEGYQVITNEHNLLLFKIIRYSIKNGINYNKILDKRLVEFIAQKRKVNPRTLTEYLNTLDQYGLLLILSRKPLQYEIFENSLLEEIAKFHNTSFPKIKQSIDYLPYIEKELTRFKSLKKKNEQEYQKILADLEIQFIHHSLSLEGNPLTLPETIKLLKKKIIPKDYSSEAIDEVRNYQQAMAEMLRESNEKKELTKELILGYHKTAMQHRPEIAGKIRKISVYIKGNPKFKIAKLEEMEPKLEALLKKYQVYKRKKHTTKEKIEFAAYFHNEFQHIHPFIDGNSRTSRLLTFFILQSENIPILDLPFGLLSEYMSYTKGYEEREDKKLAKNLQKIILANLKKINIRLR